jgi:hypothetical protein
MIVELTCFCYNIEQMFGFVKRQLFQLRSLGNRTFILFYHYRLNMVEVNLMNSGQSLVIQGALLGCLFLAAFGWIITADAAGNQPIASENLLMKQTSSAILPPMVERLNDAGADPNPGVTREELFEASVAYTPNDLSSPADFGTDAHTGQTNEDCQVGSEFPDKILAWCELITQYANQNGLDPSLIAAVILQESGGQQLAYSHSGAVGLMQVMPRDGIAEKFMCKNGPCFSSRPTISELEDPEFNIAYGTRMLAGLEKRFGNIRDALKSYGPMDVGYSYADKVLAIWERYGN